VKAVSPVYRDVRFVPTGGVNPGTLASYLELPSVLACGGTWICDRALLRERRFDEIERLAREAAELTAALAPVT
jgi:2-dehydro-3-deoxyphosphogluconate aldolase/(4S)-4-hydroxy-2-oxoglutarate aldolase